MTAPPPADGATARLSAGSGRARIRIPARLYPLEGFATEHDPLHARVLLLDDGSTRIAFAVIELTSLFDDSLAELADVISTSASVARENILISASHTFSAPHIPPHSHTPPDRKDSVRVLQDAVNAATREATEHAVRTLRPARITFGSGISDVNVNRDVATTEGWWLGSNPAGESDKEIAVVGVRDLDGRPIAFLLNYAVQSSVMNESLTADGTRAVTADLAGAAVRHMEHHHGDTVTALFLIGAAGDQAPYLTAHRHIVDGNGAPTRVDIGEAGHLLVDLLGERLGSHALTAEGHARDISPAPALRVLRATVTVPTQRALPREDIRPSPDYAFRPGAPAGLPFWVTLIGDVAVVGTQVELSSRTGADIKQRSPFPHTLVTTMVNGADKYLPDEGSYDRRTYEAMSARYSRGSAEALVARILDLLLELRSAHGRPEQAHTS